MIDLDLWFPEDFDKRYAKYREEHTESKMPEPFLIDKLTAERERFSQITDETEYQQELEKWRPLIVIMDAIYKELSPLERHAQSLKMDLGKLQISESQSKSVLLNLVYERVCKWRDSSEGIISNVPVIEYLQGNVVVPDYDKFQNLKKEVDKFFKFVEHQKEQKFAKDSADNKSNELIKKLEEVSKDKEEKIDTTIKRVATWGGDIVSDLPLVDYNEATGKGEVIGRKKFKFKDGNAEFRIFKMLYAKLGKKTAKLERQDVLVAGGFYKDYEEPDPARKTNETDFINDIAKAIRTKTDLTTEEFVNNNGSLTLLALRQDKNPPKVVKYVPVWG
jgi:hypothetical protein